MHGYDIVDHNTLNPEIGTEADYDALAQAAAIARDGPGPRRRPQPHGRRQRRQRVVDGRAGKWARLARTPRFSTSTGCRSSRIWPTRSCCPFWATSSAKCSKSSSSCSSFEEGAFWLHYFDRRFPIEPRSWAMILNQRIEELTTRLGNEQSAPARISKHPDGNQPSPRRETRPIPKKSPSGAAKKRSSNADWPNSPTASPEVNAVPSGECRYL